MDVSMMRLDKYLAEMGVGSRSEVKKHIRQGSICVDGQVVKAPELKVDEEKQTVTFQGQEVGYARKEYYMLHKPAGVVSATTDPKDQTVIELIRDKKRKDLFPVGRLDKDTEGLLLITNDGDLAHRLLAPNKHVNKVYYAKVAGRVTTEDVFAFQAGVTIGEGEVTKPAALKILEVKESPTDDTIISEIELTIQEGKFHQVKRMFEAVGKEVIYLKRLSMGMLVLDDALSPGGYRPLTKEELKQLC